MTLRVLALDPYHSGSHAAFINGWKKRSTHRWSLHTLPGRRWKWRMRHAALTFGEMLDASGTDADVIVTTDMLNAAELRAFLPRALRDRPIVVYFHESQLTYPTQARTPAATERDLHFAFTNILSALAADAVWFNSAFHRDAFLGAIEPLVRSMPDHRPAGIVDRIRERSLVAPPGIDAGEARSGIDRNPGPLRIVWNARWEHDKGPGRFFEALELLAGRGCPFRVSVLGEQFRKSPAVFESVRRSLAGRIGQWGYIEDHASYMNELRAADVVVSTALHEFFGIGVLEAVAAGSLPLVPESLAYPETLGDIARVTVGHDPFHDGTASGLAHRLGEMSRRIESGESEPLLASRSDWGAAVVGRFGWSTRVPELDRALVGVVERR